MVASSSLGGPQHLATAYKEAASLARLGLRTEFLVDSTRQGVESAAMKEIWVFRKKTANLKDDAHLGAVVDEHTCYSLICLTFRLILLFFIQPRHSSYLPS